MEKKNNNGLLVGILIGIIILLLVVIVLFATGTISFKTTTNNKQTSDKNEITVDNDILNNTYLEFINKKEYNVENILEEYKKVSYIIYDVDGNGIDELLLRFTTENDVDGEWDYTSIYTYENNNIKLIKTIYAWSGIQYNKNTKEIIYTELKTSGFGDGTRGNSIGYYKLINNNLELTRTIQYIFNLSTNKTTYYEIKNEKKEEISLEDYNKITAENIHFDFINIED